jgi:hypothetical protein
MSQHDSNDEDPAPALYSEPLLAIEKKLIAWSLGIGVSLLIALAIINRLLPLAG